MAAFVNALPRINPNLRFRDGKTKAVLPRESGHTAARGRVDGQIFTALKRVRRNFRVGGSEEDEQQPLALRERAALDGRQASR